MKKIALISIVMVFLFSITVFAQGRRQATDEVRQRRDNMRLNLTEEQKSKLKELRESCRTESSQLHKDLREAKTELRKLMEEKDVNESVVNQKVNQINSIQADLLKKRIKLNLENRKVYTAEQWEKLKNIKKFALRKGIMSKRMAAHRRPFMMNRNFNHPQSRFFDRRFDIRRRPFLRDRMFDNQRFQRPQMPQRQRFDRQFDRGFGSILEPEFDLLPDFEPDVMAEDLFIGETK